LQDYSTETLILVRVEVEHVLFNGVADAWETVDIFKKGMSRIRAVGGTVVGPRVIELVTDMLGETELAICLG